MFKWIANLFRPEPPREITAVYVAGPSGPVEVWEDFPRLMARAIDAKQGDKQFALFYDGEGQWEAMIGNDCPSVMLGEIAGQFSTKGETAVEAVQSLIRRLDALEAKANA